MMARGLADQHHRATSAHEEMVADGPPVVSADFAFPGDADSDEHITALVMRDSSSGSVFAHPCPGKATTTGEHSEYIATKVTDDINSLGNHKVIFKTE